MSDYTKTRERLHCANPQASGGKLEGGRDTECATIEARTFYEDHYESMGFFDLDDARYHCRAEYAVNHACTGWQIIQRLDKVNVAHYTQPEHEKRGRSDADAIAEALDLLDEATKAVLRLAKRLRERDAF